MVRRRHGRPGISAAALAVRLHDAAAGLAVGIGLLRFEPEAIDIDRLRQGEQALAILVEVQANLKHLSRAFLDIAPQANRPADLELGLKREAKRLGVSVEIEVVGETKWLPANHAELVWLVSREGLRNVHRHSGSAACQIQLHLRNCPFVLRIRDWGGGVGPGAHIGRASASYEKWRRRWVAISGSDLSPDWEPSCCSWDHPALANVKPVPSQR